jgi:hypothetical protein
MNRRQRFILYDFGKIIRTIRRPMTVLRSEPSAGSAPAIGVSRLHRTLQETHPSLDTFAWYTQPCLGCARVSYWYASTERAGSLVSVRVCFLECPT